MSAYIVADDVLHFVLSFMLAKRQDVYVPSLHARVPCTLDIIDEPQRLRAVDRVGAILLAQNYRSVNCRYSEQDDPHDYRFREHSMIHTMQPHPLAVQVLKACQHFDYQACETADYEQTDAAYIIRDIRAAAIRALPGYDAAAWGAPERPATGPISIMSRMAARA